MLGGEICASRDINTNWKYDTRAATWTEAGSKMPESKYDLACTKLYLKDGTHGIMAAGGINRANTNVYSNTVHFLDLSNEDGAWETFPTLPLRYGHNHWLSYLGK